MNWNLFQSSSQANIKTTSNTEFYWDTSDDNSMNLHTSDKSASTAKGLLNGFSKKNLDEKFLVYKRNFGNSINIYYKRANKCVLMRRNVCRKEQSIFVKI